MNKTYRSVWNEALGAWVAVSETTKAKGKPGRGGLRRRSKPGRLAGITVLVTGAMGMSPAVQAAGSGCSCVTPVAPPVHRGAQAAPLGLS